MPLWKKIRPERDDDVTMGDRLDALVEQLEGLEARQRAQQGAIESLQLEVRKILRVRRLVANVRRFCDVALVRIQSRGESRRDPSGLESLTIVTASDHTHFKPLLRLLFSVEAHEPGTRVIFYDLGLRSRQARVLRDLYPTIEMRRFEYERYPAYLDIREQAGHYAWKPVIIREVMHECAGLLAWMDAGNLIVDRLEEARDIVKRHGFYSPRSAGEIQDWTHPGTLRYLQADEFILTCRNRSGGLVMLDTAVQEARDLIERWSACALVKECIAPEGSNRDNHRQDQAVLGILVNQCSLRDSTDDRPTEIMTHQDQ